MSTKIDSYCSPLKTTSSLPVCFYQKQYSISTSSSPLAISLRVTHLLVEWLAQIPRESKSPPFLVLGGKGGSFGFLPMPFGGKGGFILGSGTFPAFTSSYKSA
ncbi:hypothetical protein AVEN_110571-1 [Araneus ventricosus]|uniref:Uncharacterized protein n=1 Tax=Araneus ventricosus TaxID=182803 RepID=A0A4Y2LNH8_ARAVE|nr:hypothetical protein AVEN_110571-1 [Araneus ventricosus]